MRYIYVIFLFFGSLLPVTVFAQSPAKGGSFADIAFIEGHWKAKTAEGRAIEAFWMGFDGDNILGMMRMMNGDKTDLYELLAYEISDQGLVSMVKHFKPGLLGQEEKNDPNRYIFVEASKDRATFVNVNGDLRILYEKRSPTQFAIARGNKENDKWVFKDLFVFDSVK